MRPADRGFLACAALSAVLTLLVGREVLLAGKTFTPTDLLTSREPWAPAGTTDANVQNHLHQDILEFFAAHAFATSRAMREGESLLWNPAIFCGLPMEWDPQLGTFYPPRHLALRLLPPLAALDLLILLHFFLAGPAFYACVRAHGAGAPAAVVAAAVWQLCGQQMVWFKYPCGVVAAVFLPLVALALHRAGERRSLGWAAGAGAIWALMFTGANPQLSFFALVWAAVALGSRLRDHGARWTASAAALFGLACAGLGAVQLLPFLEGFLESARSIHPDATSFARPWRTPLLLLTLFWQRVWGSPIDRLDLNSSWMGANFFEFQGYLGLFALAAALWAARRHKAPAWTAAACLAVATVYPLWRALTFVLPPLSALGPHRLYLFAFAMSLLCALGLDRALAEPPRRAWFRASAVLAGGILLAGLAGLALSRTWITLGNPAYLALALAATGVAAAVFVLGTPRPPAVKAAWVGAALLVDLLPGFLAYNAAHAPLPAAPPVIASLPERDRAVFALESAYWRFLFRNHLMPYGHETPSGFASLYPRRTSELAVALGGVADSRGVHFPEGAGRAFRLLNVRTLVTRDGRKEIDCLPRAWIVGRAEVSPDALRRLADPSFDPRTTALVETAIDLPGGARGGARGQVGEAGRDVYGAVCHQRSLLVVSESWAPGWTCTVDGKEAPVLRANHALRAVVLEPGAHELRFLYRPLTVRVGAWITGFAALALGLWAVIARRARGAGTPPPTR